MQFILPPNFEFEDIRRQFQEIITNPQLNEFYMNSPDGTSWKVTVDNNGNLTTEEVD